MGVVPGAQYECVESDEKVVREDYGINENKIFRKEIKVLDNKKYI